MLTKLTCPKLKLDETSFQIRHKPAPINDSIVFSYDRRSNIVAITIQTDDIFIFGIFVQNRTQSRSLTLSER